MSVRSTNHGCERRTFAEPPTMLHACRGPSGQHPVRCDCRPEVVKLVLQRSG
jgi:hypothetical protein